MSGPAQPFNIQGKSRAELDAALIEACASKQDMAEIKALLQAGASPHTIHENKADCLTLAVLMRNETLVETLLRHGANVHYDGFAEGKTALMWAAHMGQRKNVVALLDAGADPLKTSQNGKNAMDWAEDNNKIAVREMIRDFIRDREQARRAAEKAAAEKAEADAFRAALDSGLPLDHAVKPLKPIRLKRRATQRQTR